MQLCGSLSIKLNNQGDNIQPWRTPFPIWNQSVPCPVLTVASWPAYRFVKRQVRWSSIPISFRIFQFIVIYTVKGFGIFNKAEIDVFLELSCFFDNPEAIWSLVLLPFLKPAWTSGSSRFMYCWSLEKGMANHFSILALRTPWTVWKGKMIGYWKRNSPGQ